MKKRTLLSWGCWLLPTLVVAQTDITLVTPTGNTTHANVSIGVGAGSAGANNVTTGYQAGAAVTSSQNSVFMGYQAGNATTTGYSNTFIGSQAGKSNTTGYNNTFAGYQAGYASTGSNNVFSGYLVGYSNAGHGNLFLGTVAGYTNTTGGYNVFTGFRAGQWNTSGNLNVFSGSNAGYSNTTGNGNVFEGAYAGYGNLTASSNVAIGDSAGLSNQTGAQNTFIGYQAGLKSLADSNTFVGYKAGVAVTTGKSNTYFGAGAGTANTTGSRNTFVGRNAGSLSSGSDDNVYICYQTGAFDQGHGNTFLGNYAGVDTTEPIYNATAIGYGAQVAMSNAVILGNGANVGIGTSTPQRKLEVVADEADQSGLRLSNLTSQSQPTQLTDQFLTVNAQGDVVKARYQLRITSINEWSDNVFLPGYSLPALPAVKKYIDANGHLPGVPSAEQVAKEGVNLVKMNAILLTKVEELTLYSIQLEKTAQQLRQKDQHVSYENRKQQAEIIELKRLMSQVLQKKGWRVVSQRVSH